MRITTEYIKLDSFLKAVNEASSGGEAKILVAEGSVAVNGVAEIRRGRKLRPGDTVSVHGKSYPVEGDRIDECRE
jgi:ribosome-associated protein